MMLLPANDEDNHGLELPRCFVGCLFSYGAMSFHLSDSSPFGGSCRNDLIAVAASIHLFSSLFV